MRTVAVKERATASSALSDVQKSSIPDCWACAPVHLMLQPSCVYTGHLYSTWEADLMRPDVLDWLCMCGRVLEPIFVCNSPDKQQKRGSPR